MFNLDELGNFLEGRTRQPLQQWHITQELNHYRITKQNNSNQNKIQNPKQIFIPILKDLPDSVSIYLYEQKIKPRNRQWKEFNNFSRKRLQLQCYMYSNFNEKRRKGHTFFLIRVFLKRVKFRQSFTFTIIVSNLNVSIYFASV